MEGVTDKCKTCGGSGTVPTARVKCEKCEREIYVPIEQASRARCTCDVSVFDAYMKFLLSGVYTCPDCEGTGNAVTKDKEE